DQAVLGIDLDQLEGRPRAIPVLLRELHVRVVDVLRQPRPVHLLALAHARAPRALARGWVRSPHWRHPPPAGPSARPADAVSIPRVPLLTALAPADRRASRAAAHVPDPVVMIGDGGPSRAVLAAAEPALGDHALTKFPVLGADRAQRQALLTEI